MHDDLCPYLRSFVWDKCGTKLSKGHGAQGNSRHFGKHFDSFDWIRHNRYIFKDLILYCVTAHEMKNNMLLENMFCAGDLQNFNKLGVEYVLIILWLCVKCRKLTLYSVSASVRSTAWQLCEYQTEIHNSSVVEFLPIDYWGRITAHLEDGTIAHEFASACDDVFGFSKIVLCRGYIHRRAVKSTCMHVWMWSDIVVDLINYRQIKCGIASIF